jgi:hypothetical protein
MILRCGFPLQRNLCFSKAFVAKAVACSSVCRLSLGSDIHSRMIVRRASCSGFIFHAFWLVSPIRAGLQDIKLKRIS